MVDRETGRSLRRARQRDRQRWRMRLSAPTSIPRHPPDDRRGLERLRRVGALLAGHEAVNHSVGEYVGNGDPTVHTNTVEGFFSIFKRGMRGVYQHCGRSTCTAIWRSSTSATPTASRVGVDDKAAPKTRSGVVGKRLTYETVSRRWPVRRSSDRVVISDGSPSRTVGRDGSETPN